MKKPAAFRPWPWEPVDLSISEIAALKALADGRAEPSQQKIAYETVIRKICAADAMSYAAGAEDGRRATDFAEGKRWVALAIRQAVARELPVNPRGAPPPMPSQP